MPAPDRPGDRQTIAKVLDVPKGIVGHYTDLEIDALLAGLSGGTLQTVDLSAYATTAYVDGELAKVYDKAEVDALLATLASGGTIDLDGYLKAGEAAEDIKGKEIAPESIALEDATKAIKWGDALSLSVGSDRGESRLLVDDGKQPSFVVTESGLLESLATKADLDNPAQNITAGRLMLSPVGYIKYGDVGNLYLQTDGSGKYELVSFHEGDSGRVEHIYVNREDLKPYTALLNSSPVTQELLDKYAQDLLLFIGLKADQATTYTKAEVDQALANVATGGTVDLSGYATQQELADAVAAVPSVAVYEQDDQPADGKEGDLWLSTPVADPASVSVAVRDNADTTELDAHVTNLVRKLMTGGQEPPADIDWTVCPKVAGSGTVEAKLMNGIIYLRGECVITTSSYTKIRTLPPNFPRPASGARLLTGAAESGVAERVCQLIIGTNGDIHMSPLGQKITVCYISCSFPVL